jgi:UDP-glucose 4-epimerase
MKILVTGGAGFIGHNVVKKLQDQHKVTIVDNLTDYDSIPASEIKNLVTERKQFFTNKDIAQYHIASPIVADLIEYHRFDLVIHLASFPRQKVVNMDPMKGSYSMMQGLLNLLHTSAKHGVKRFIYASSSMVYGDWEGSINESAPCQPLGQYAIMKYAGELLVKDYARKQLDYTIVRPSAVYGPRDVNDRVVSKFLNQAIKNETLKVNGVNEILDFTHVDDTSDGIVGIVNNMKTTKNKTYNITRGIGRTIKEAADICIAVARSGNIEIKDKDVDFPSRGTLNCANAKDDFGYDPRIDIEEGFADYYKWVR